MEKTYDPKSIETKRYKNWENEHYFAPQKDATNPYCIMIPPPNVTGTLHMGHGFQHTIMDILSRYHRMLGDKTLWQPGLSLKTSPAARVPMTSGSPPTFSMSIC